MAHLLVSPVAVDGSDVGYVSTLAHRALEELISEKTFSQQEKRKEKLED